MSTFAWMILTLGILVGLVVGYMVGRFHRRTRTVI